MDLAALQGARSLAFVLSSNKVNDVGPVTPFTFAVDNVVGVRAAVPEPSAVVLLAVGGAIAGLVIRSGRPRLAPDERGDQ